MHPDASGASPAAGKAGASKDVSNSIERDFWRDTYARYLGYANEIGEAFRPIARAFVVPSYAVAFGYVLADTADKTRKAASDITVPQEARSMWAATRAVDTLVWQTFASVLVPGLTINRAVRLSQWLVQRAAVGPAMTRWGPTILGIAIIPAIVEPIDHGVEVCMDASLRPLMRRMVLQAPPVSDPARRPPASE